MGKEINFSEVKIKSIIKGYIYFVLSGNKIKIWYLFFIFFIFGKI